MTADAGSVPTIRRRRWPIAAAAMAMVAALAVVWASHEADEVVPVASVLDAVPTQVVETPAPVPAVVVVPVIAPAIAPPAAATAAVVAAPRHPAPAPIKAPVRKPTHRDPNATVDAYR